MTTLPSDLSQTGRLQSWVTGETAIGLCLLRPHPILEFLLFGVLLLPREGNDADVSCNFQGSRSALWTKHRYQQRQTGVTGGERSGV